MADQFQDRVTPATNCVAVTPSDTVNIAPPTDSAKTCKGLYVGTTGNVAVLCIDDTAAVTFVAVPAGAILPVSAKRVNSTNTTASNIVAMF